MGEEKQKRVRFEMRMRPEIYAKIEALANEKNQSMARYVDGVLEKHYDYLVSKGWTKAHLPKTSPEQESSSYEEINGQKQDAPLTATQRLVADIEKQKKHGSKL